MQNRYTGDIGDFGKLVLLRKLHSVGLSIGVNWYLTPDETHNGDGRHIEYLQKESFAECDRPLWIELKQLVESGRREVTALQDDTILQARFFSAPLDFYDKPKTERETIRRRWHMTALHRLSGCDIVFADPDNGLITPSAEGTPKSNKYVYPFELLDYYKRGASVIYYQHKARKPDSDYIAQQKDLITSFGFYFAKSICMKFTTTSQRYYFFIVQSEHFDQINIALDDMLANAWGEHFTRL